MPRQWQRLNEVKSSTRIKDEHLDDIALQTYVIVGVGLELVDAHLVFINDKYVGDEEIDWRSQRRGSNPTWPLLSWPKQTA
jgi:hypothetical protein